MAYSLVGEIISLLSDLVSEKTAEQVWGTAIKQVSELMASVCAVCVCLSTMPSLSRLFPHSLCYPRF